MVNAVSFSLSDAEFATIPATRTLCRGAKANEHGSWVGVDYLILCSQHCPTWVAKIQDIILPREADGPLCFRFSEIRSVWGKGGDPEYLTAYKPYRVNGYNPQLTAFEDDAFFRVGEPVPFVAQPDTLGPLSLDNAIEKLAETYGVKAEQIEITIRSRPATLTQSAE